MVTLQDLVEIAQRMTPRFARSRQGKKFILHPVQVAYYTLYALLQRGVLTAADLEQQEFPARVEVEFRKEALKIAGLLVSEYPRVQKKLEDYVALKGSTPQAAWQWLHAWLCQVEVFKRPALPDHPHWKGLKSELKEQWRKRWEAVYQELWVSIGSAQYHLEHHLRMPRIIFNAPEKQTLALLLAILAEDRAKNWAPSEETYLFQEPFDEWLVRPLLSGRMLMRVCQLLGDQAEAMRAGIHYETLRAASEMEISDPTASDAQLYSLLPKERRRSLPVPPEGMVMAERIFLLAVQSWHRERHVSGPPTITPASQRLAPADFRALVKQAAVVMLHQLWDEAARYRALQPGSPAFMSLLRQSVVPECLWEEYEQLLDQQHSLPLLTQPPRLVVWDELLGPYGRRISARLEASALPPEALNARALPRSVYLYDRLFLDWCRAGLRAKMPDFCVVVEYSLALAEAQGAWPGKEVVGAPHSAEEAGLLIACVTKLAVEALLTPKALEQLGLRPERSLFFSPALPQRADSGPTLWIGQPMLPAALELARVLVPIIAHFLYAEATDEHALAVDEHGQVTDVRVFLPVLLQIESAGEWQPLKDQLAAQADRMGCDQERNDTVVADTVARVSEQLSHLPLAHFLTLKYFEGDKTTLKSCMLHVDNKKYICYTGIYRYTGDLKSYILSNVQLQTPGAGSSYETEVAAGREEQLQPLSGKTAPTVEEQVLRSLEAPPPLDEVARLELAYSKAEAIYEVLHLMVETDLSAAFALPAARREKQCARQQAVLARRLWVESTGKQVVNALIKDDTALGLEVERLAGLALPEEVELYPAGWRLKHFVDEARPPEEMVLLAQLLAHPKVRESPLLRERIAWLFHLPFSQEAPDQPQLYSLARLERAGSRAMVRARRGMTLRALKKLGEMKGRERRAVVARLWKQPDVRLTLDLLLRTGWAIPKWLERDATPPEALAEEEAQHVLDTFWPQENPVTREDAAERQRTQIALVEVLSEPPGAEIFRQGRARWHRALMRSSDPADRVTAGLVAEWVGYGLWDEPWLRPRGADQEQAQLNVFLTLLAALPPTEGRRLRMASRLMRAMKLSLGLPELLGLVGCLAPQLPQELDDVQFLRWLSWRVFQADEAQRDPASAHTEEFSNEFLLRVRASLVQARAHFARFFQALGCLPEEERRVLLAALSVAQGQPERVCAWLDGEAPDPQTRDAIVAIVHCVHHRIALKADQVPALLAQTGGHKYLKEAWHGISSR